MGNIAHMTCVRATQLGMATVVALTALQLTGCSTGGTIKPNMAAKAVVDLVAKQNKYTPTDVTCPSGIAAKVGDKFDCNFTGPRGVAYLAHMTIAKVSGENATFDINVERDKAKAK